MASIPAFLTRHRRILAGAAVLALIGLGFAALDRLTHEIRYSEVRAALHGLGAGQIALSIALTAMSYLALTFYDVLALRVIDRPLPWRTAALASFTSYTLSHNLGLSLLTGGSARYRIYGAAGLDGPDVARVIALAAAMFWAGVVGIAGLAMLVHGGSLPLFGLVIPQASARVAGLGLLALLLGLGVIAGRVDAPVSILGMRLPLPRRSELTAQIAVALVDITCATAALFVLLPGADPALLPAFVLAYAIGLVAALASHVPGGIGIFESVVLATLPGDHTALFAALIAYRLIYYLLPLALGVVLLVWHEARARHSYSRLLGGVQVVASNLSPLLLSSATFLGGAMLLLSGSLPAIHTRIAALAMVLPLPLIEVSHVGASMVGTALLLLSPGLYRRLDGACLGARMLLLVGAVFSLTKGFDYEEAAACLILALLLQLTRRAFHRHTALTGQPLTKGWLAAIAMVAALAAWAGLFAYRHVPYSNDLWWKFALHADAPRYLRAMLGSAVFLTAVSVWKLLAPTSPHPALELEDCDWPTIKAILARSRRSEAMLALTGDKRFLVSPARDAFVMYQVKGTSWIVMGDPVGERQSWASLLWRLREMSHRRQGRILLYEVSAQVLDLAIGMGLQIIKFGEEAVIDLPSFTLETPQLRSLRKSQRVAERAGACLRIVPAPAVPAIVDRLRAISDEWVAAKNHQEKGFSLGRFEPSYICSCDVAVVIVADRIVAFANLWLTRDKHEASVDLMRQCEDAPAGTMDFLFAHLLLWAKAQGYQRFILGVVPLSGIDARPLAPVWAKAAGLIFRHGETFYGFRGLRSYKEKFAPHWEARYVAGPHGIGLIQALHDVSRLISNRSSAARAAFIPGAPANVAPAHLSAPSTIPAQGALS